MGKVISVSKEDMRTMSSLDRSVISMRSKGNPRFDTAIDKHIKLKKEYLKQIIGEAA